MKGVCRIPKQADPSDCATDEHAAYVQSVAIDAATRVATAMSSGTKSQDKRMCPVDGCKNEITEARLKAWPSAICCTKCEEEYEKEFPKIPPRRKIFLRS